MMAPGLASLALLSTTLYNVIVAVVVVFCRAPSTRFVDVEGHVCCASIVYPKSSCTFDTSCCVMPLLSLTWRRSGVTVG